MASSAELELILQLRDEASAALGGVKSTLLSVGGVAGIATGAIATGFIAAGTAAFQFSDEAAQAQRELQASLGLTEEQTEQLGNVAEQVFLNNFGDNITHANELVGVARQQLGELNDLDLQNVVQGAQSITDTFEGADYEKVINSVKAIRDNFPGTTEQEALDFITAGFQRGLDSSGDFLDSIGEYSVQFGEAEADAGMFFSALETGLQSGVLGTDKIADAFKESRIRITEVSDEVLEAFQNIGRASFSQDLIDEFGTWQIDSEEVLQSIQDKINDLGLDVELDPEQWVGPLRTVDEETGEIVESWRDAGDVLSSVIFQGLEDGSVTAAQAQEIALSGLRDMDNQLAQNSAGVKIFGTQWEDLGANALLAVDTSQTALEDLEGATDSLAIRYESFPQLFESFKRSALVGLQPVGDELLAIATDVMPIVQAGFEWLSTVLPPIINTAAAAIKFLADAGRQLFANDLVVSVQSTGMQFDDTFKNVEQIIQSAQEIFAFFVGFYQEHADEFIAIGQNLWNVISNIVDAQLTLITGILSAALQFITGDWEGALETLRSTLESVFQNIVSIVESQLEIIQTTFGIVWEGIVSGVTMQLESIISGVEDNLALVESTLQGAISGLAAVARDIGGGILDGIIDPIESGASAVVDAITGVVEDALDAAKDLLGIDSPSKVFKQEVGEPTIAGWIDGVREMVPHLIAELEATGSDLVDEAKRIADQLDSEFLGALQGTASLADQELRNLERLAQLDTPETSGERRIQRTLRRNLEEAAQEAQQFRDQGMAAEFLRIRSDFEFQLADLMQQLFDAETSQERQDIRNVIDALERSQEAQLAVFQERERQNEQAFGEFQQDVIGIGLPSIGPIPGLETAVPQTLSIQVDARGSIDPRATAEMVDASVKKALREAGLVADARIRT